MSVFHFDIQNDATMDPSNMNSKNLNISHLGDQTWALNDYRDISFDYSYASSNSTFSCGSLTPQSSVSASTSRRQSLVCSAMKSMSSHDSMSQAKGFRRPRTPVNLNDRYSTLQEMATVTYNCTTPDASPSSQELENMFIMNTDDSAFTDKLQAALSLENCDDTQGSSFLGYGDVDTRCQGLVEPEAKSFDSSYSTDQFSSSIGDGEDLTYHGLPTESTYSHLRNNLSSPQTIIPSQTYQEPQPAFLGAHVPPRILGDPFVSPTKKPSGSSYVNELQRTIDPPEDPKLYESAPRFREDFLLQGLGLCQSFPAESEFSDGEPTIFSQSASESPNSDAPSLNSRRRQYRKSQAGSRSADSSQRPTPKQRSPPIKKEGFSKVSTKHPCPKCILRFNRPEHLSRHLASVHGDKQDKIWCVVPNCKTGILTRTDNMNAHYRNCHMYGPHEIKGKKRKWLSIEDAERMGLGHMDPRTNPTSIKSRSKTAD